MVRSKAIALLLSLSQAAMQATQQQQQQQAAAAISPRGAHAGVDADAGADAGAGAGAGADQRGAAARAVLGACFSAVCCLSAAAPGSLLHDAAAQEVSGLIFKPPVAAMRNAGGSVKPTT